MRKDEQKTSHQANSAASELRQKIEQELAFRTGEVGGFTITQCCDPAIAYRG
jgi:hypothetical protein